jgi:ubiquinone/menaquinone biosynthesis C-methylase UbiE
MGDLTVRLASEFGCEVVGLDPLRHSTWGEIERQHPSVRFIQADIAEPKLDLADNSFDVICSFVVWEHIHNPWTALQTCQRLLKPSGVKFLRANLYRSAIASHLYSRLKEPWPHLLHSPREIAAKMRLSGPDDLGWAYWVNKLTYQQYLFYFRQLGFHITHEKLYQAHFDASFYKEYVRDLGLYPKWDLKTDFFEVLLEFDANAPKALIRDPVYRLRTDEETPPVMDCHHAGAPENQPDRPAF